ncbi:hypothetical protein ID866_4397 [Astraeus odoratus]|nr:hypothetical protein ID866_4397 [Astraeus odoratus]
MSIGPKSARSLRIITLPLTKIKLNPGSTVQSGRPFVYYHFNLAWSDAIENSSSWMSRLVNKLTLKATETWANLGKAPTGSWKMQLYEHGERLVDRLDFEELALKGVDPSLGPCISNADIARGRSDSNPRGSEMSPQRHPEIRLIYPPSVYSDLSLVVPNGNVHPSLSHLQSLLSCREPRHRRGFYLWMFIAPLTFPITIIPIIPNIPFFFCAWRAWSHYRAYKSSQYLSSLIEQGLIKPKPSQQLDAIYRSFSPSASNPMVAPPMRIPMSSEGLDPKNKEVPGSTDPSLASMRATDNDAGSVTQGLLLTREAVPKILELFHLPESAAPDMYRAMEQVRVRLKRVPVE